MLSARRILEVGSFTGFSTLCMAEATHAKVIAVEHDPYLVNFARKFFEKSSHGHKIELICGDALNVIRDMGVAVDDESRFDLIFIDGNKTQYAQYFQLINDRDLLAPGGLICIDETLWKGSVYSTGQDEVEDERVAEAMRELNRAIASDPRLVSVLLPIRNGLTLVRRLDDQVAGERDHFGSQLLRSPTWSASAQGAQQTPMRPRQRRGITQEGLAPQQSSLSMGGKRSSPSRMAAVQLQEEAPPASKKPEPEAKMPETAACEVSFAHEASAPELDRQWSAGSAESEFSLPMIDSLAQRIQTC
mmetsp:Transcript_109754/g.305902  ORF Transcript_109754/g.305902 Transcript_109754/m.305902 type:complete len:303 (-) Transcript_109754:90-998(-)